MRTECAGSLYIGTTPAYRKQIRHGRAEPQALRLSWVKTQSHPPDVVIPMPRRAISCQNCGFFQRKRAETCEQCGVETEQSKRRTNAYLCRIELSVLVALAFYAHMSRVIPGISG